MIQIKIKEIDPSIKKLVEDNDGYCPCAIEQTYETRCMCVAFREQAIGKCLCGRYEKVIVEE